MWTCQAFNKRLNERVLRMKCIRFLHSFVRCCFHERVAGPLAHTKGPATLARILHNFIRTSENEALARVVTSGFFTRRHDQTC